MKKSLSLGTACLFCLALFAAPAGAESITWPDNGVLRTAPIWNVADSLFPDALSGNTVTVNGDVTGDVYGGVTDSAQSASNNRVFINSGTVGGDVLGGISDSGDALYNSVSISGGEVGGHVYGGASASGDATYNSASISGGEVTGNVLGGYSTFGVATHNSASISGGAVDGSVYGGASDSGNATSNSASISGGEVDGSVYGGFSQFGDALYNSVTLYGGLVQGDVVGGFGDTATHNTVTILRGAALAETSGLYGGRFSSTGTDLFTGNTLNVWDWTGTVGGVQNFQFLSFGLPAGTMPGDTILLVKDGTVRLRSDDPRQLDSSISVNIEGGGRVQLPGETYNLIQTDGSGSLFDATDGTTVVQGRKGISLDYLFDVTADTANGLLTATPTAMWVNPQTKALLEARLAGLGLMNQGQDLTAYQGLYAALGYLPEGLRKWGLNFFAVGQGGTSRYDTGSHVDVDGFSLMTGLAWNTELPSGSLMLGAFFEAGWGSYDSHNSFNNYASVKGDGDISYYGGGVLGRYDFAGTGPGNFYVDASFRAGQVDTDFSSGDLYDYRGRTADYDSSSAYYGAHAGLGYLWNLGEQAALDLSVKYLWTHMDSDSVTIQGDPIRFKAVDSQRLRAGGRFSYAVNEYFTPYAGAYYDHEFDGKARGTTYGYAIDAPDLEGGTGVGELGLSITPVKDSGFSLDLGVQGYTGVREGVSGNVQAKWEF